MAEDLTEKFAYEIVAMLKSGEISVKEVIEASRKRHEEVDRYVNALPLTFYDKALKRADEIDLKKERKNKKSLFGLPIAVKDYNDVEGIVTTYGSKIFEKNIPTVSDATVQRLKDNGAIPVAKSNVPEWAGGHTFNPVYGVTRNPFNLEKVAGGSSGGSSVALATNQVWLATGNDLGGSLRTPAGFNNIVGLRPSVGVVPRGSRYHSFDSLWVEGPLGKCVTDIALMLDAGAGFCETDPLSFQHSCHSFVNSLGQFELPAKVAFTEDLGIVPVEREVRSKVRNVLPYLRNLGVEVGDEIPDFTGALEAFHTLRGLLLAYMMGDLLKSRRNEIQVDIVENIEVGFEVNNEQIISAENLRQNLYRRMTGFFKDFDFLICPASSVLPFDIKTPFVTEIDGIQCKTYIDWFAITFALTLTSCPVISLPIGFSNDGLPVGIQILGKPREEDRLLAFAKLIEEKVGLQRNSPI
mgnify:FL=1